MTSLFLGRPTTTPDTEMSPWRKVRHYLRGRPFLTVILAAVVLAGLYYAIIAAPQYASTSRFAIRTNEPTGSVAAQGLLEGLASSGSGLSEITAVSDYIRSFDMLEQLDGRVNLRGEYSGLRADLFRRLPAGASDEDFLKFYRRQVVVRLDRDADLVEVEVRSFDRDQAHATAAAILSLTETFIDGLSRRMRDESVAMAQDELSKAQLEVEAARAAVERFRSVNGDVNPSASGSQVLGGIAALESQISQARGELASLLTYSRATAPQVQQLRARIASLQGQINAARSAQSGAGGANMSARVTSYETLLIQRETAEKKLASALVSFDTARTAALQRGKYVVRVVNPNKPQEATYPRRLTDFVIVIIFVATAYALTMLILAGIRDHRGN